LLQAKDIQLLAATGTNTKQKLLQSQQDPLRPGQRSAFESLAWLEVLGTSGSKSTAADTWHQCFSAAGPAADASGHPLRLTSLNVLVLENLPDDVQLAHLVRDLKKIWKPTMLDFVPT
jgi:hypothetical protein